jgi:N-acetylglucosamine kinase-like BadF-type ATPase
MIAVVYSGSRYANWKLAEKGKIISEFKTPGINPFFNDESHITQFLNKNAELINNAEKINRVYFFGAGASSKERQNIVNNALGSFFRFSKIVVDHDLKAAALAACGDEKGIIGILGSGSNAAYFDSKKIGENNFGLGYILGDEGSANWFGRRLLKSYLNDLMPAEFAEKFKKKYDLDRTQILDKVYRQA